MSLVGAIKFLIFVAVILTFNMSVESQDGWVTENTNSYVLYNGRPYYYGKVKEEPSYLSSLMSFMMPWTAPEEPEPVDYPNSATGNTGGPYMINRESSQPYPAYQRSPSKSYSKIKSKSQTVPVHFEETRQLQYEEKETTPLKYVHVKELQTTDCSEHDGEDTDSKKLMSEKETFPCPQKGFWKWDGELCISLTGQIPTWACRPNDLLESGRIHICRNKVFFYPAGGRIPHRSYH